MKTRRVALKSFIVANAAVFTLLAVPAAVDQLVSSDLGMMAAAWAGDDGGGGSKGHRGGKPEGAGSSSHRPAPGEAIPGKGGPGDDATDAKGPRFMGGSNAARPAPGSRGGAPAWAKDALVYNGVEPELGRLNVARAPDQVFNRQLVEALTALAANPSLYQLDLATAIQKILAEDATYVRIDSPLQNLALLKDLFADSKVVISPTLTLTATDKTSFLTLAALFLGSAADKTIAVEPATVYAIDKILGVTLPYSITNEELAAAADSVRTAIQTAHDN